MLASFLHEWLTDWQMDAVMRLLVTIAFAGLVGLEREFHGRAAGFRTHVLVGLGCCLIMLVSLHFERMFGMLDDDATVVRLDPARMAYGAVTGIGFLGAGVIIKTGTSVHGLTTAASLWCVAAIGLALGTGMYFVSGCATLLMLISLTVMRSLGSIIPAHSYRRIIIHCSDDSAFETVSTQIQSIGGLILSFRLAYDVTEREFQGSYRVRFTGRILTERIFEKLRDIPALKTLEIR